MCPGKYLLCYIKFGSQIKTIRGAKQGRVWNNRVVRPSTAPHTDWPVSQAVQVFAHRALPPAGLCIILCLIKSFYKIWLSPAPCAPPPPPLLVVLALRAAVFGTSVCTWPQPNTERTYEGKVHVSQRPQKKRKKVYCCFEWTLGYIGLKHCLFSFLELNPIKLYWMSRGYFSTELHIQMLAIIF